MNTELLLGFALIVPLIIRLIVAKLGTNFKTWRYTLDIILLGLFVVGIIVLVKLL